MFYLHTDKEREKVGKKWFQDAGFCTLHFPCSVLGQAAKSRLSYLKIQKLVYLTLCCAGLHPWEHCLWRHCRSQSTVKQKETLYLRGSDFPCEIFHLIPRQISLCGRLPKRPFSTYNKSQIPLVSLIRTRPPVKQIAVLFLRVKSLCCKLRSKLPLLYCAPLFFFTQPVTWLHVEKIISSIISSASHGQKYALLHVRHLCAGWCPGMLWSFWCPRTYLSVPKLFDPSTEATAILFSNITAACRADDAPPTWEGRGAVAAFITVK